MPPIVCIIGKKKSGKTRVTVEIAAELSRRGWKVMTIKHGHAFDLDREGTDSWRHQKEGQARRVILAAPHDFAIMGDWPDDVADRGPAALTQRFLADADIVLVEGFKSEPLPKIEVYRRAADAEPIYHPDRPLPGHLLAVATDVLDFPAPCPVLDLDDPTLAARLADIVERQVMG